MLGIERGIKRVIPKLRTVAYVEIEAFINFNLVAAMESNLVDTAPIWTNLKTFNGAPFYRRIHGITGGYPCQPFSTAGKREGTNDPRHLWPYIQKLIQASRPVWCFFENVENHINLGYGEVYRSLSDMGYSVEAEIFSAEEVGAPHKRKRIFILAIDKLAYAYNHGHRTTSGPSRFESRKTERKEQREKWNNLFRERVRLPSRNSSSKNVANSNDNRYRALSGGDREKKGIQKKCESGICSRLSVGASEELANTYCKRLQNGNERKELNETNGTSKGCESCGVFRQNDVSDTSSIRSRESSKKHQTEQPSQNGDNWPAKPGQKQYGWEEPRTIESGLGCTVNGYNFRTDLLRMYGNGVVEQTAEIAFITLMNNFLKNNQ